jgi:Na+/proline symporter
LTLLDWGVVCAYLALTLIVGLAVARRAGTSLESYYVADRNLPWWWLGTSMVATTFAADTPLVVVGLIATHGVAGNWFWWSWAIGHVAMAVMFAGMWRRAHVLTDAELVELRYTGRGATALRAFKALFLAIVLNGIVLGWVVRAMAKIAAPFVQWSDWLGAERMQFLQQHWPHWLLVGGLNDTLTVIVLFVVITLYSSMGGIRGVILTDLLQFAIAIVASVLFAAIAVSHVGGLHQLVTALDARYDAHALLSFVPSGDAAWLPLHIFAIYLAVQWWAQYFSDGSGYLAQRLFTARDDAHAQAGGLWFAIANYGLRTWPWVLVGLVALVVFPLGAAGTGAAARVVAADREMAYPVLMATLLPAGLVGLLFASLLAAFMSTVDTHINWGSSYLTHDVYRRFLRPAATQRELVLIGRVAAALVAVLALLIAARIDSIEKAWRLFVALGAGLGLPAMLRWLYWRVNAWTEIAGMSAATVTAAVLYTRYPTARDEYLLLAIVSAATVASLVATFATRPVPHAHLAVFVQRVRPVGWWRRMPGAAPHGVLRTLVLTWLAGVGAVFGLTFGIGHLLLGRMVIGATLLVTGALLLALTLRGLKRARAEQTEATNHREAIHA